MQISAGPSPYGCPDVTGGPFYGLGFYGRVARGYTSDIWESFEGYTQAFIRDISEVYPQGQRITHEQARGPYKVVLNAYCNLSPKTLTA